jgi:hypothetical protein
VLGLDSQGIDVSHGDDDSSLGIPFGKFKLEDILGDDAPSRYGGILRNSHGSQKDDSSRDVSTIGGEFMDDGMGCAASKNLNPNKPGLEAGSNVTSLFLKQQARAAELLVEQEIATKQAKVAVATGKHLPAPMNFEAENVAIRVRGGG